MTYTQTVHTGQNKTSSANITCGSSTTFTGRLLAFIAFDNLSATTPVVNSLSRPAGEFANWSRVASFDSPQAASGGGVRGEVWTILATSGSTATIVAGLSASVTAKAINVVRMEHSAGSLLVHDFAVDNSGTNVGPIDVLAGEWPLFFAASEGTTATTQTSAYVAPTGGGTNLMLNATTAIATAGGSGTTNVATVRRSLTTTSSPDGVETAQAGSLTGVHSTTDAGGILVVIGLARGGGGITQKAKIWTGSAWTLKPAKVWNGSAWVEKQVKISPGSTWP